MNEVEQELRRELDNLTAIHQKAFDDAYLQLYGAALTGLCANPNLIDTITYNTFDGYIYKINDAAARLAKAGMIKIKEKT